MFKVALPRKIIGAVTTLAQEQAQNLEYTFWLNCIELLEYFVFVMKFPKSSHFWLFFSLVCTSTNQYLQDSLSGTSFAKFFGLRQW